MEKRRKAIWNKRRAALAVCSALGWWGAIYPQFAMLKDTYRIVYEDEAARREREETGAETDGADIYWEIMGADSSRIRFRSRLFTELGALRKYLQDSGAAGKGE